jgi:hypothetical protein
MMLMPGYRMMETLEVGPTTANHMVNHQAAMRTISSMPRTSIFLNSNYLLEMNLKAYTHLMSFGLINTVLQESTTV